MLNNVMKMRIEWTRLEATSRFATASLYTIRSYDTMLLT